MRKIAVVIVLISTLALAGCGSKSSMSGMDMKHSTSSPSNAGEASAAPLGGSFLSQPIPKEVLEAKLFDSNGNSFSLSSLKGQTVVIADFLTS